MHFCFSLHIVLENQLYFILAEYIFKSFEYSLKLSPDFFLAAGHSSDGAEERVQKQHKPPLSCSLLAGISRTQKTSLWGTQSCLGVLYHQHPWPQLGA